MIETDHELALAVAWLSWLKSRRETVEARLDQQIRLLRYTAAEDLQVEMDGASRSIDEWYADIETAVLDYCEEHQDRLTEQGQTLRYPAGDVKYSKAKLAIEFFKSKKEAEQKVLDGLPIESIREFAAALEGFLPWLKVSVTIDVEGIKRAVKENEVGKADLRKRGMRARGLDPNDMQIAVKPKQYPQQHVV